MKPTTVLPGAVVQITPDHREPCYRGCFLTATECHPWGLVGLVAVPLTRDRPAEQQRVRVSWEHCAYIGRAPWTPAPENAGDPPPA